MKILWDEPKRIANLNKHGMDFAKLSADFFESSTVYPVRHRRWMALGALGADGSER